MKNQINKSDDNLGDLFAKVSNIIDTSREIITESIYNNMSKSYYLVGKLIVEDEQLGKVKGQYGTKVLETLSQKLTFRYGRGYSVRNLREFRSFYLEISKRQTVSAELNFPLSYSNYQLIFDLPMTQQIFYERLSIKEKLSVRELKQAIDSSTFERYSNGDKSLMSEIKENSKSIASITNPITKDPLVLDFIGIKKNEDYAERELEQKIINNLEQFLLELGRGFAFMGRQSRITISGKHFYLDLVFYHVILNCYVIIDLKKGRFTHQDAGQMLMYVNYYDSEIKKEGDNPTIGIILCADKDKNVVEFTLKNNNQIYATQYLTYLPTKQELIELVDNEISQFNLKKNNN